MSCPETRAAPFVCPTVQQSAQSLAALAPRGKAWPVNDGGGLIAQFLAWLAGLNGAVPTPSQWPPGYVQAGLFAAIAAVKNYVEAQWCALKQEFWCASAQQTLDLWNAEYGLPDPCDPFADLCLKVSAPAGTRCAFFVALAAAAGWVISCSDFHVGSGTQCGSGQFGSGQFGMGIAASILTITVFLSQSPAYTGVLAPSQFGLMQFGMRLSAPPDISPLKCLLARVIQAHLTVNYVTA
jgi:hypothetical protein